MPESRAKMVRTRPKRRCLFPRPRLGALVLLWSLVFWVSPPLLKAAELPAEPNLTLRCFRIVGADVVKAGKLKKEMTMPLPSLNPFKKKPTFHEEDLQADIARLKLYYRTQGFYHAAITPCIDRRDGEVEVTLKVNEGPPILATRIEVHGAEVIPGFDRADIREKSELHPGSRYTDDRYENLKRSYNSYLQNHGFFHAKVTGKVYLDDKANTARIVINIDSGPVCYFGRITVKGAEDTPRHLILHKLTFQTGELFSLEKTYESQKNLYNTDLFKSASIIPQKVPESQTAIPMTVTVLEKKRRSVKVGLGYGDEELFRARLGLRLRNVGGGGRLLDIDTKYSSLDSHATVTFTNPQIFKSHLDFVASAGWVNRQLPTFTDQSYFTYERLERDLPWNFRAYLGHAYEYAQPFDVPLSTLVILENTQPGKSYRSSMVIFGLNQNTTVNPSDPTGGGQILLSGEFAPDFLGSNLEFYRTTMEVRRYHTIVKDVVFMGRLKFGLIQPIQETTQIPIQRRFFSGGYNSVRGYRLFYLGPRAPDGDPIGGDAVIEGNLQTSVPLYKKFRGIGFLDFGNVFFKAANIDLGQLKYAAGFGVNYLTPIGPAGLYFAWPLNPISPSVDTMQVHFTIGPSF
uniref:Outer membrane protein assembly factor BamA n=1 Tax=Desulfobacca acetoxidans TaxID=60893 RepID=A0A7V6DPB7_9BACT